jgi:hypothetical protein
LSVHVVAREVAKLTYQLLCPGRLCLSLRFLGRIRRHGFLFYGADDVDSNMCSEPFGMKSNTVGSIKGRYDGMHESDIESSSTPTARVVCASPPRPRVSITTTLLLSYLNILTPTLD